MHIDRGAVIFGKTAMRALQAACLATMLLAANAGHADQCRSGWQTQTEFYLKGINSHHHSAHATSKNSTVAGTAIVKFVSCEQPYHTGLIADYSVSGDVLNLGGFFRYNWRAWDATTWLSSYQSRDNAPSWMYAGRLRMRVADNHKLGMETFGSFHDPAVRSYALGYYATLSRSLSLNVLADPGFSNNTNVAVRMELLWQIH